VDGATTPTAAPVVGSAHDLELESWPGTDEDVLEGELHMRVNVVWASEDGTAATGIWQADPVRLRLTHPFDETFVLLSGRLTVTPDDGEAREMRAADFIVLREGARCVWEIHEPVTKLFSIHRRAGLPL
jgi:uncharacterized cupin superfamily protein